MFEDSVESTRSYDLDYEEGVIEEKILYELSFNLEVLKLISNRQSDGILDVLGNIGGYNDIMGSLIGIFGTWFASKFFLASVAESLFIRHLSKAERK